MKERIIGLDILRGTAIVIIIAIPNGWHTLLPFTPTIGVALICYMAGCLVDLLPVRYKHWIGI